MGSAKFLHSTNNKTHQPGVMYIHSEQRIKGLTLMLLVANLPIQNDAKSMKNSPKPWHMGTHLKVLTESFLMSTNMTGFRCFSKIFASLCFGQKLPQHWKG